MLRRGLAIPILILSLFAIMGTSVASMSQQYIIRKVDDAPCPDPEEVVESIDKVADAHGLKRVRGIPFKGEFSGDRISIFYTVDEHGSAKFFVRGMPSGLFFTQYPEKKMEEIKKSLMNELGHRFTDMEFVIPLTE